MIRDNCNEPNNITLVDQVNKALIKQNIKHEVKAT